MSLQVHIALVEAHSRYGREKLQERLVRLSWGVALIKVGAVSEVELKDLMLRVEDALAATWATVEEGFVPRGGMPMLNAGRELDGVHLEGDAAIGARLLYHALQEPMR